MAKSTFLSPFLHVTFCVLYKRYSGLAHVIGAFYVGISHCDNATFIVCGNGQVFELLFFWLCLWFTVNL